MTMPTQHEIEEQEANLFTVYLLMPEDLLRAEINKIGSIDIGDDKAIKKLADKFKVSVTVMTLRLGQISQNLKPILK